MFLDQPRGLQQAHLLAQRRSMLDEVEAVQPLRRWISDWQGRRPGSICPDFDPAEAGIRARVLVLLEAPGPMSHTQNGTRRPGTGFISVDNPDQTAANTWAVRREAGLTEDVALHWNIVPWYLGPASKKPKVAEVGEGAAALRTLLPLLPDLRAVVLAGRFAQGGWARYMAVDTAPLELIHVPHPSPLAMTRPGRRELLQEGMHEARHLLDRG